MSHDPATADCQGAADCLLRALPACWLGESGDASYCSLSIAATPTRLALMNTVDTVGTGSLGGLVMMACRLAGALPAWLS